MDFLTAALYHEAEPNSGVLKGAVLTRFDELSDVSRAETYYVTVDELRERIGTSILPAGFSLGDDGVLMSDTACRRVLDEDISEFIEDAYVKGVTNPLGIIDVVLHGANIGASIIANPAQWMEGGDPILISLRNFKVSDSSFNIYAPYRNSDDKFRTYSMIDIETDKPHLMYLVVGDEHVPALEPIKHLLSLHSGHVVQDGCTCFEMCPPLKPAAVYTGEAFCHYLSFNVMFYRAGVRIIQGLLQESNYVETAAAQEEREQRKRVPAHNLSIICNYKNSYVNKVLSLLTEPEKLNEFCSQVPEAAIDRAWIDNIFYNYHNIRCEEGEDPMSSACISLLAECNKKLQHFSLELLAQRLYLFHNHTLSDPIVSLLHGGGVIGSSYKRITW